VTVPSHATLKAVRVQLKNKYSNKVITNRLPHASPKGSMG
jgi:hypothetical protein